MIAPKWRPLRDSSKTYEHRWHSQEALANRRRIPVVAMVTIIVTHCNDYTVVNTISIMLRITIITTTSIMIFVSIVLLLHVGASNMRGWWMGWFKHERRRRCLSRNNTTYLIKHILLFPGECVYIYIYIYIHIHTYMYTYTYTYSYTNIYIYINIYTSTCIMCMCITIYIYIYICIFTYLHLI